MLKLIAPSEPAPPPDQFGRPRAALARHLTRIAAAEERLGRCRDAQRRRDEARAEELRLVEEARALDAAERAAWDAWARAGAAGDPPEPRADERRRLAAALRSAADGRAAVDAAAGATLGAAAELQARAAALAAETRALVSAVLAEEAEALAERHAERLRQTILVENAMLGLRDAALARGDGELLTRINHLLRRGREGADLHAGARGIRARWRALADRLAADPGAREDAP